MNVFARIFWSDYPTNVWLPKDISWNTILGGGRRQTISDRIGDKFRAGRWWARAMDKVFLGHFSETDEETHETSGWWESSLAMLVGAILFGGYLWARWTWPEFVIRRIETPYYGVLLAWILLQELGKKVFR